MAFAFCAVFLHEDNFWDGIFGSVLDVVVDNFDAFAGIVDPKV